VAAEGFAETGAGLKPIQHSKGKRRFQRYFYLLPNNLVTSDESMGDTSRTVALLFPKSATASNSAYGVTNIFAASFVGTSPKVPSP
jgi:hypothetical protein